MHQQRQVHVNGLLALPPLLVRHLPLRPTHVHRAQRVLMQSTHRAVRGVARGAKVYLAWLAAEAVADQNVLFAVLARRHELGRVRVVQVVEDHHASVLGAAQLVELVVVALVK